MAIRFIIGNEHNVQCGFKGGLFYIVCLVQYQDHPQQGAGNGVEVGKMSSLLPNSSARKPSSVRTIKSTTNRRNADTVSSGKKSPFSESTSILTTAQEGKVLRALVFQPWLSRKSLRAGDCCLHGRNTWAHSLVLMLLSREESALWQLTGLIWHTDTYFFENTVVL